MVGVQGWVCREWWGSKGGWVGGGRVQGWISKGSGGSGGVGRGEVQEWVG